MLFQMFLNLISKHLIIILASSVSLFISVCVLIGKTVVSAVCYNGLHLFHAKSVFIVQVVILTLNLKCFYNLSTINMS